MQRVFSVILFISFTVLSTVLGSGCGLLFTTVKPVDEKSKNYRVADLSKDNLDWTRLEPSASDSSPASAPAESSDLTDVAYQSKQTASIISLNSACRLKAGPDSLAVISHELILGVTEVSQHDEKNIDVSGMPALETTLQGKLNGEPIAMKTVVLKKEACTYDLIYVARPAHFLAQQADFSHFVSSLHLK